MFLRVVGNLFHSLGAATWNARSPKVFLVIFLGIFDTIDTIQTSSFVVGIK